MRRLLPDPAEVGISEQLADFDPIALAGEGRPYTFTNFALTVDGRATIGGVSGPIGSDADTAMLVGLRTIADAILIGGGTMRAERYGRPVSDPEKRALRARRGLAPDPLMVIVAGDLARLPWDAPLFTAGGGRVLIVTAGDGSPPATETAVEVERIGDPVDSGRVDLLGAMAHLRGERGIRTLLCEGGPSLHARLLEAGLVDEIFLTRAPTLGGGTGPGLFDGLPEQRRAVSLRWLLAEGDELFARYRVSDAGGRTGGG